MGIQEIIGWIGAVAYVVTYFLLSIRLLSSSGILYHALNALGGLCLVVNAIYLKDNPTFFVNAVWMAIALASVVRIFFQKETKPASRQSD